MSIIAKYSGKCAECGEEIEVGEEIEWTKGEPTRHTECPIGEAAPAAAPLPTSEPDYSDIPF